MASTSRSTHLAARGDLGRRTAPPPMNPPRLGIVRLRSRTHGPYTFTVETGELLGVMGPSGSGKTQLLRAIADLDPNQGQVMLDGKLRESMSAPTWRRRVVYVAADPRFWCATVREHFDAAVDPSAWLDQLGLPTSILDRDPAQLSSGEAQRIALLRAVAIGPRVLLLDEPTRALDHANVERVEALLHELTGRGVGIVLVSHDADQLARVAHRTLTLNTSELVPGP